VRAHKDKNIMMILNVIIDTNTCDILNTIEWSQGMIGHNSLRLGLFIIHQHTLNMYDLRSLNLQ